MNWWKIFPFFGLGLFGGLPLLGVLLNTLDQMRNPKYTFDEGKEVEGEEEGESEREEEESSDPGATHREQSASPAEAESNRGPAITALSIGIFLNIIGLPLFIGSEQENLGMLIPGAIAFGVGGAMIVVALIALLSSWTKSHAKTGKPAPGWTKVLPPWQLARTSGRTWSTTNRGGITARQNNCSARRKFRHNTHLPKS